LIMLALALLILLWTEGNSLNNGVARTPPMGWATWNLYHREFTEQVFYDAADIISSTDMKKVGYEYINVDGGWWWSLNSTVQRNTSGYAYFSPSKYPDGITTIINYIHSKGLKYGHYTDAGTAACDGDKQMSEHFMPQDVALFYQWGMDMIKVDACNIAGNDTEIIFEWRDMLNATGKAILFSDCHNQCMNDASKNVNWQPWCIDLANMWRVSKDIQPHWSNMLHNFDCTNGLGKYAQPGAWSDPDFLEVDIGEFLYDGTTKSLLMNQAHFSLWCIASAPLIAGNNLTNMSSDILSVLTNKDAIDINQNYLNNGGDVITEFNISDQFRKEYENQVITNKNMTGLYYKPLPTKIGQAAFVFLNRDNSTSYQVSLDYNQLPLSNDQNNPLKCTQFDIWSKQSVQEASSFKDTLPPQSVRFIRLSDCK